MNEICKKCREHGGGIESYPGECCPCEEALRWEEEHGKLPRA